MDGHDKVFESKAEVQAARPRRNPSSIDGRSGSWSLDVSDMAKLELETHESQDEQNVNDSVEDVDHDFQFCERNTATDVVNLKLPKNIMQCEEITSTADSNYLTHRSL